MTRPDSRVPSSKSSQASFGPPKSTPRTESSRDTGYFRSLKHDGNLPNKRFRIVGFHPAAIRHEDSFGLDESLAQLPKTPPMMGRLRCSLCALQKLFTQTRCPHSAYERMALN